MIEAQGWPERPSSVPPLWRTAAIFPGMLASIALLSVLPFTLLGAIVGVDPVTFIESRALAILTFVVAAAGVAGLVVITVGLRRTTYAKIQEERDRFAAAVADLLLKGCMPPPYSLYLRPFFTDGALTAQEGLLRELSFDPEEIADIGQRRDGERAVAQAVERHAPLVALGRTEQRLGAGRIETADENWRTVFDLLIRHASRVVIVPIGQPATLEEVRAIAADPALLEKTVFVRPANRRSRKFSFAPDPRVRSIDRMWDWTRGQVRDLLPAFPPFRGGTRLFCFAERCGEPIDYHGNGVCTVQQPSGAKAFLVAGRTSVATLTVSAVLWVTLALLDSTPVRLPVFMEIDQFPPDHRLAEALSGLRYLGVSLLFPALFLAVYKIVTGDIPRRLGLAVLLALMGAYANSFLFSAYLAASDVQWSFGLELRLKSPVLLLAQFSKLAVIALAAATLTGRRVAPVHLAILLMLAVLQGAWRAVWLQNELFDGAWAWVGPALAVACYAVAMVLPLWTRRLEAKHALALVMLALAFGAAAMAILLWSGASLEAARMEAVLCREPGCAGPRFAYLRWLSFAWGLVWALPFVLWPLLARRFFRFAAERRWAERLDPYDEAPHSRNAVQAAE